MIIKHVSRVPVGKLIVIAIALIHLIFLIDGISFTVNQDSFYSDDEDIRNEEILQAIFLYGFHIVLIYLLIHSVCKSSPGFLVPWLVITFPCFAYMTIMVLLDLKWYSMLDILVNFLCIGCCWYLWISAFLIYKTGEYRSTDISDLFSLLLSKKSHRKW